MGRTFFPGEDPVIYFLIKYLFMAIFLVSGISKYLSFEDTLIYFASLTMISFPLLSFLLWILILSELLIPALVWMNGFQSRTVFLLILILLVSFLITNIVFLFLGLENCGCFGVEIQSHPVLGIAKTVILIMIWGSLRGNKLSQTRSNFSKFKR